MTLAEVLVALVILGTLAVLLIPRSGIIRCGGGGMTALLNNARQLQIATQMMALDTKQSGSGMDWTTIKEAGLSRPVTLAEYFDFLLKNNYLSASDLKKALAFPGKGPSDGALNAGNICFKIFRVDSASPADQPFVVTANWTPAGLTDEPPYGKKGFVMFAKGGSGGIYTRPTDPVSQAVFPTGPAYHYETLK